MAEADNQAQSVSTDITASIPIHGTYHMYIYKPPVKSFSHDSCQSMKEDLAKLSKLSLEYYNSSHKRKFDLVDLLYLQCVTAWNDFCPGYLHMSFTARSRDSPSKVKLFFAEVYNYETEESFVPYVKSCTPVDPGTPFCSLGCGKCHTEGVIYHPHGRYLMGGSSRYSKPRFRFLDPDEESAKKLLHEKYIFKAIIQALCPEEDEEFRKLIDSYAMDSIRSYNWLQDCVIEFLEIVAAVHFYDSLARCPKVGTDWVHLTFLAKNADGSVELFFAEVSIDDSWVTTCVSLTRADLGSKSEAKASCKMCHDYCSFSVPHPEGGYIAGIDGGTFIDAMDKEHSWRMKVDLEEK